MHYLQSLTHKAFADHSSKTFFYVNDFFALLTIVSIVAVVLETVPSLAPYKHVFLIIEWVAVSFFTVEYIGRTLASKPMWKYPTSFFGYIDLLAILPTFLGLGNFTFLKSARALRIIRLLRMARLAKISRSSVIDEDSMGTLSLNVLIYFLTLTFALLITGTAMYLIEPNTPAFSSIPAGMWWSLKVFMAGIPVMEPTTALGELFFVLTRFVGLLLLGLLIGVVGNVFRVVVMGERGSVVAANRES
jgi:voltage-gated potassium channel